jgi:transposase
VTRGSTEPTSPTAACAWPPIPALAPRLTEEARRRARGPGRPYAFGAEVYKQRNVVERCFRLKQWRGVATRYDKTARNYRGGVLLASLVL